MNLNNRTKIIATIGPASNSVAILKQLIGSGCSVFRVNFSHGSHETHIESIKAIREAASSMDRYVAIMGDLQGPKIRIGEITEGTLRLVKGQRLILDSDIADDAGSADGISYQCKTLAESCEPGRILVLDDGRVQLEVISVENKRITTRVLAGDRISSRKGLNLKGGGLAEEALTDKDKRDIQFAKELNLDYLCVSFPSSAQDMIYAKSLLDEQGCSAKLIAKLERAEVVANQDVIDDIIQSSDGVMVARGDLAVEIGYEHVTSVQKLIIKRARTLNKPVIVATQMMESMIDNPVPTRAEVSDVANAVFDHADAVMLSAETAVGKYPLEVVQTVYDVVVSTEQSVETQLSNHRITSDFEHVDETIAMATLYSANHFKSVKAIICLTESGSTALWMSRIKTALPMVAMSYKPETLNRVALYRGVVPAYLKYSLERKSLLKSAVKKVNEVIPLGSEDYVVLTYGDIIGVGGHTNTMKVLKADVDF